MADPGKLQDQSDTLRAVYTDDPLADLTTDQLGRSGLASSIRSVLLNLATERTSTVISVVGPWGSGKTTLLNALASEHDVSDRWSVVHYNPWTYSTFDTAVQGFFAEIKAAIPSDERQADIRGALGGWVTRISPMGAVGGLLGVDASGAVKALGDALQGDQSPDAFRRKASELLGQLQRPILVLVDDLDRSDPGELLLTFKLIRLLGRLPNLSYMLAYDERTLLDTLTRSALVGQNHGRAREYLEKIVQVRFDIPPMLPRQQAELVNNNVTSLQQKYGVTLSATDNALLQEVWDECMSLYLTQPRAIKRLFTQIDATFGALVQEVNLADYVSMIFLQTFERPAYDLVHKKRAELVGYTFPSGLEVEKPEETWSRWLAELKSVGVTQAEPVAKLLAQLFHVLRGALAKMTYGHEWGEVAAKRRGVGSSEYFDRYFQLGVPDGDLPEFVIDQVVEHIVSAELGQAADKLKEYIVRDADLVVTKLRRRHELAPLPASTLYLLAIYYPVAIRQRSGPFWSSPSRQMLELVVDILGSAGTDESRIVLESVMQDGNGLDLVADLLRLTDDDREEPPTWRAQIVPAVAYRIRETVTSVATNEALNEANRDKFRPLWALQVISPADEFRRYVRDLVGGGTAWTVRDVLAALVPMGTSTSGHLRWESMGDLEPNIVETFFDIDELACLLGDILYEPEDVGGRDRVDGTPGKPSWAERASYAISVVRRLVENRKAVATRDAAAEPVS